VQGLLLKEYPNKLLAALILCLFGTIQSFPIAVIMERDHGFSRWKLGLDLSLVSVAFAVCHHRLLSKTPCINASTNCNCIHKSHVSLLDEMQGIMGTGVCVYLQAWCVDMKGPVFLAMWNPLNLLLTVFCSSLLGQTIHLGRYLL
jgi:hypothetical protein